MARTIPLIAALLCGTVASAQDSYLFELDAPGAQPYVDLVGATPVQIFNEEGWHTLSATAMGTPWLFGTTPTAGPGGYVAIGEDGLVRFGNDYTYVEVDLAHALLDPIDGNSGISYRTSDGIVELQYKHMGLFYGLNDNYMNAQLRYHAATGMIEFHYGPRSDSNGGGFVGNRGPKIGLVQRNADGTECQQRVWLTGDPDNPQVDYMASNVFTGLSGLPTEGTVFRFVPLFTVPEGITENDASPFRMKSNLVSDQLMVTMDDPGATPFRITDTSGRAVLLGQLTQGDNAIALQKLSPGAYSFSCTADGRVRTLRFVKE